MKPCNNNKLRCICNTNPSLKSRGKGYKTSCQRQGAEYCLTNPLVVLNKNKYTHSLDFKSDQFWININFQQKPHCAETMVERAYRWDGTHCVQCWTAALSSLWVYKRKMVYVNSEIYWAEPRRSMWLGQSFLFLPISAQHCNTSSQSLCLFKMT